MNRSNEMDGRAAFVARMREVVEKVGGVGELARLSGLSRRAIQNYLAGSNDPSREMLVRMARVAGVGVGWLAAGEREAEEATPRTQPHFERVLRLAEYAFIPMLAATAEGRLDLDEQATFAAVFVDRRWLGTQLGVAAERAMLYSCSDDQMAPTILPGHILLVDTGVTHPGNGIYLLAGEGVAEIRRLQVGPEGILVSSDNPHYQPYRLAHGEAERLRIIGHVRMLWRPWRV
ncbi:MAG: LexA family transcriptional regulator [Acidithiobacillus ferrooxidans]